MTGGGKSSKPPKVPKKSQESKSEEIEEELPSANTKSDDDDAVTDALTIFSDGNPKKVGRGQEKNMMVEMSDTYGYRTPPEGESTNDLNTRLQRIFRHWAGKWSRHENLHEKYQILFAFNPPWNDCIADGCLGPNDGKARPPPPANAHPDSLKTIIISPRKLLRGQRLKQNSEPGKRRKGKLKLKMSN